MPIVDSFANKNALKIREMEVWEYNNKNIEKLIFM